MCCWLDSLAYLRPRPVCRDKSLALPVLSSSRRRIQAAHKSAALQEGGSSNRKAGRLAQDPDSIISPSFYWSKQVSRPDQNQGVEKETSLLHGSCCLKAIIQNALQPSSLRRSMPLCSPSLIEPGLSVGPPSVCWSVTSEARSHHQVLDLPPCSLGPLPVGEVRCHFMRKFRQPVERPEYIGNEASCKQSAPICQLWERATTEANPPAPAKTWLQPQESP